MKEILRSALLNKRKALPPQEVRKKSKKIHQHLVTFPIYKKTKMICYYVSYDNEVYTHDIIKEAFTQGKHVVVPKCDVERSTLFMHTISSWKDLSPGAHGILEPPGSAHTLIPPEDLQVIIVPGVGFDRKCYRIGHGRAYYDNYLPQTNAVTIGLCFEQQLVENLPVEVHDIQMNMVITEDRVLSRIT